MPVSGMPHFGGKANSSVLVGQGSGQYDRVIVDSALGDFHKKTGPAVRRAGVRRNDGSAYWKSPA
jgi:hypothetical protein